MLENLYCNLTLYEKLTQLKTLYEKLLKYQMLIRFYFSGYFVKFIILLKFTRVAVSSP